MGNGDLNSLARHHDRAATNLASHTDAHDYAGHSHKEQSPSHTGSAWTGGERFSESHVSIKKDTKKSTNYQLEKLDGLIATAENKNLKKDKDKVHDDGVPAHSHCRNMK